MTTSLQRDSMMAAVTVACNAAFLVVVASLCATEVAGQLFAASSTLPPSITSKHKQMLRGVPRVGPNGASIWTDYDHDTIFVAIAAFRDVECVLSVRAMYAAATNPRRVFLGIIEQIEHGDPTCVPDEMWNCVSGEFCPIDNIRRRRVASRRGKGPCYGRYVSMLMYRGEGFYLMMDSHQMFVTAWDRRSIAQIYKARSSRPVLSHYPNGWDKNNESYESHGNVIVMCNGHYTAMGYVRMDGRWMARCNEPRKQPFSAGGYLFASAAMVHDAVFDPYLDFLFDGEEILYSARMWTHGWDIFTPGESLLFHDYRRHTAIRYWTVQNSIPGNQGWHDKVTVSQQRAQKMMRLTKENTTIPLVDGNPAEKRVTVEFDKYDIGKHRTMQQFNDFAMIDAVYRKASDALCHKIEAETLAKSGL